ncbi:MAG TPA: acyl-CoA synthetase, partial [Acidimicrobiia bacterium]
MNLLSSIGDTVHALHVLTRAGLLRPQRPDLEVRALRALQRWGIGLAAGCTVAAARSPDQPAVVDERGMLT